MSLSYLYSDLSSQSGPSTGTTPKDSETAQEELLENFESGYQAGWDDALKSCTTEQSQAVKDVAQTLQDMSFTYHEAYSKITKSMRPLMTQIVDFLLPEIAHKTLGPIVLQHINEMIDGEARNAIELVVAPQNTEQIQAMLEEENSAPFILKSEPTLTQGQTYLRVNEHERLIDLDVVLANIKAAITAFYENAPEEIERG